jgi:hypothetical protein
MTGPQRGFLSDLESRVSRLEVAAVALCVVLVGLGAIAIMAFACGVAEERTEMSPEPAVEVQR